MAWSQIPSCRLMISSLVSQGMNSFENSKAKPNTSKADLILPGLTQITIKVFAGRAFYLRVRQGTISFNKISSSCGKTNIIKNCPWCQLFKIKRQALQMQTKTHCHPKKRQPEFQLLPQIVLNKTPMKVRRDTSVVFVGAGIWNNVFFGYFGQYTRGIVALEKQGTAFFCIMDRRMYKLGIE